MKLQNRTTRPARSVAEPFLMGNCGRSAVRNAFGHACSLSERVGRQRRREG